jgi:hypothetical protein
MKTIGKHQHRREFLKNMLSSGLLLGLNPAYKLLGNNFVSKSGTIDPTTCAYAPPGEYIKDHTLLFQDGWWHLFSISGTQGYYHGYNGNEETFSWSVSKDLVEWEIRGHVMHPSQRAGTFDQHEVWAPFCIKANGKFYMFYTGIIHPYRPMEYRRLGFKHPWVAKGHKEAQGLAISEDLTDWLKISDPVKGLGIPGRDSNVVWDSAKKRWLLYSTGAGKKVGTTDMDEVLVSVSGDMIQWELIGTCALFPKLDTKRYYGNTVESWQGFKQWAGTTESTCTMKHPLTGKWILMGNWQYVISDDPLNFRESEVRYFNTDYDRKIIDMGFACEIVNHDSKWYRSGVFGITDYWKLGFTEIAWIEEGAFNITKPSILSLDIIS